MSDDDWWELDVDATMAIAEGFCPDCRAVLTPAPVDQLLSGPPEAKADVRVFGHCAICCHFFLIGDGTFTLSDEEMLTSRMFPMVPTLADETSAWRREL